MHKNDFKNLIPKGVEIIKEEDLSNQGAWLVELKLTKESAIHPDAVSVQVIQRDPEVKPPMIAVFKNAEGCESDLCQAYELTLKNDRDVVALIRANFS